MTAMGVGEKGHFKGVTGAGKETGTGAGKVAGIGAGNCAHALLDGVLDHIGGETRARAAEVAAGGPLPLAGRVENLQVGGRSERLDVDSGSTTVDRKSTRLN